MTELETLIKGKPFRPLLSATIEDDEQLKGLDYPLIASPKIDGIRVLCHPTYGPCTRSLKPVPNEHIRKFLSSPRLFGLDGEITVGPIAAPDVFNRTTSAVMTQDGCPVFQYNVFDDFTSPNHAYSGRLTMAIEKVRDDTRWYAAVEHPILKVHENMHVGSHNDVIEYELQCLARGFEGVMLRHRAGPYKWGRSTLKQQTLMKLKRFKDAEAEIIGFEPLHHNANPQTRDPLGYARRTSHKDGKVEAATLGNLLVRDLSGRFGEFSVGSGFDQATRDEVWNNREGFLGRHITYKFQECGVVDAPRFPIFKGFRPQE